MFSIINSPESQDKSGPGAISAKKSLDVCIELYKKNIWNDEKTVNVIAQGCFSPITKISVTCIKFFLNPVSKKKKSEDDDSDSQGGSESDDENLKDYRTELREIQKQQAHTKKTKSRKRKLQRALRSHRKQEKDEDEAEEYNKNQPQYRVLSLLHDPQTFAERLFARASNNTSQNKKTVERFEVRLMQLKLVSRVLGYHQLFVMQFYPFIQRYLQPHQRDITSILALFATACHQYTPAEVIQPQIRTIADNFVSDHCAPEVISAGLNAIRAVASRQPLVLDSDLLSDLIEYRKHRDKGVVSAARSLLQLYREKNPELLHKRERGKEISEGFKRQKTNSSLYDQNNVAEGVDGIELLDLPTPDGSEEDVPGTSNSKKDVSPENEELEFTSEDNSGSELENENENEDENAIKSEDSDSDLETGSESDSESVPEDSESLNTENQSKPPGVSSEELQQPKVRLETTRIITQEEFDKIDKIKLKQQEEGNSNTIDDNEIVDPFDILGDYHSRKRKKATYEERMASIQQGRDNRPKYGSNKKGKAGTGKSTSNSEKRKTKNFMMIKHRSKKSLMAKRALLKAKKK
ncbi:Protein SDA1-like protein [Zancudomyces culisetae]|uniref:Protein SDA1 n=1 Tax=Zancudomyces culisetae TaxID=1213189 RepID=A0A1R1PCX1_ZANCU|nr:Protein SDA1-like protein [Zancudomyces culisetae]OMH81819.1 Protein SDA1-like protein [Zancudomyces culisetae]|eukprot:OMH78779.1 Protein SDA1-like protein [Zancudomyces culisetae]